MANIVRETATGANWLFLINRNGETGADWTNHPVMASVSSNGAFFLYGGRIHNGSTGGGAPSYYSLCYASGVPLDADYAVEFDMVLVNAQNGYKSGACIRCSTTQDTYYTVWYDAGQMALVRRVTGTDTVIGTWTSALTYGSTYRVRLEAIGDAITVDVAGVERIAATDSSITAAGRVAVQARYAVNHTEGIHLDNITATDSAPLPVVSAQAFGPLGL